MREQTGVEKRARENLSRGRRGYLRRAIRRMMRLVDDVAVLVTLGRYGALTTAELMASTDLPRLRLAAVLLRQLSRSEIERARLSRTQVYWRLA